MRLSIKENEKENLLNELRSSNLKFQNTYPGDKPDRQPVHTVYGGANLFKSDTCIKMGAVAMKNLLANAPNFAALARVLELDGYESLPKKEKEIKKLEKKLSDVNESDRQKESGCLPYSVYNKILAKLKPEPVEDFRIDFEDGFGNR